MSINSTEIVLLRQESSYASEISRGLYLNERLASVFFTFPNSSERIPGHSYILAMTSRVFDKMFYGSSAAVHRDIPIVGHTPEAFREFLQFFYLDKVTLTANNITDVIQLLHAYKMPKCLELCGQFWLKHYNYGNIDYICLAYELAIKSQLVEFQALSEQKIAIHFAEVMKTDCFLSCSFDVLCRILAFDSLLCNESLVFGACMDWARNKCKQNARDENDMANLREYLTDSSNGTNLLHKIRFVSFSTDDYLMHLDTIDALLINGTERTDVARLVLGSTTDLKSNKFQTDARKPFWNDEGEIDYVLPKNEIGPDVDVEERHVHILKVNQSVLFGGFYIVQMQTTNLSLNDLIWINVSIEERRIGEGDVTKLIRAEIVIVPENANEFVQLKPNPIIMKPDSEYLITFDFERNQHSGERDHITFRNEVVDSHQEIKLSDSLTIQYSSAAGKKGRLLMRGFKLMPL